MARSNKQAEGAKPRIRRLNFVAPVMFGGKRMDTWPPASISAPGFVRECEGGYEVFTWAKKQILRLFVPLSAAIPEYVINPDATTREFRAMLEAEMGPPPGRQKGDPPRPQHRSAPPSQGEEAQA